MKFQWFFNFNLKVEKFTIHPHEVSKTCNANPAVSFFVKMDRKVWNDETALKLFFFFKISIHFNWKTNGRVNIASFWNFRRMDCQFLNFEVKIKKPLKFHGLTVHFPLIFIIVIIIFLLLLLFSVNLLPNASLLHIYPTFLSPNSVFVFYLDMIFDFLLISAFFVFK